MAVVLYNIIICPFYVVVKCVYMTHIIPLCHALQQKFFIPRIKLYFKKNDIQDQTSAPLLTGQVRACLTLTLLVSVQYSQCL